MTLNEKTGKLAAVQRGYQEIWYVKLNDLQSQRALWLRFAMLSSQNGFKRISEVWAIYYQRVSGKDVKKIAIKQSFEIGALSKDKNLGVQIHDCHLNSIGTKGSIQSKGQSIQWDLTFLEGRASTFTFVPEILTKMRLAKQSATTLCEELLVSGTTQVEGETIQWHQAAGMKGNYQGSKSGHSWVWGHCNSFLNEQGKPCSFIFEGLSAKAKLGPLVAPRLSSFYFYYQNQNYYFNTLKDSLYIKSKNTLNEWRFQVDRDDLSFRGVVKAEHKEFAGVTFEDTNGSFLYCSHSELADLKILVYRKGKLESTLSAPGSAGLEIATRNKNPYVPLLI